MNIAIYLLTAYMVSRDLNSKNIPYAHKISTFSYWPELTSKMKTCMSKNLCEESEVKASPEGICHNVPAAAFGQTHGRQHQRLGKWNLPVIALSQPLLEVICLRYPTPVLWSHSSLKQKSAVKTDKGWNHWQQYSHALTALLGIL